MRPTAETFRAVAAALALAISLEAQGQTNEEKERAAVEQRLLAERAALYGLEGSRAGLLTALNTVERLFRAGTTRLKALEQVAARLALQLAASARLEEITHLAVEEQFSLLEPRLATMYRLRRRDQLSALLSAKDFASMLHQERAMRVLLEEDLATLGHARRLVRFQQRVGAQLSWVRASADQTLLALKAEQELAVLRKAAFAAKLKSVQEDAVRSSRLVRELEVEEQNLAALVVQLKSAALTGFRTLKGTLPYPTQGMIEVGFGRVVNPKFNTVTVQKGLDFRAPLGSDVVAVAPGSVVFSDWLKGYGNLLILDHGEGYHTLMAHLAHSAVEVGQQVERGEKVAEVGDTASLKGPYLYFELRKQGVAVDPGPWLDEEATP